MPQTLEGVCYAWVDGLVSLDEVTTELFQWYMFGPTSLDVPKATA